jgi:dipeptidyl aminopeptidase/acylaminoacyl peptidase
MRISRLFTVVLAFVLAAGAFAALQGLTALAQEDSGPGLVVFASNRTGNYEIYVLDPATGLSTQLTNTPTDDVEPVWSPDRSKIAFASNRDGDYELYVMRADGTNVQQLTNNLAEDRQPRWQPEGTYLVFVSDVNGQWDVYSISADGATVRQLTNDPADERGPVGVEGISTETSGPAPSDEVVGPPVPAVDGEVNSYQLNVRANPGEGGRILEVIPRGTPLDILGRYYDNNWIQVQTPTGNVGWVAAWLVDININLATVPVVSAQYISPPPTATATVAITVTPTVSISFWSNKAEIKPGKCATIGWDVEGIKEVYFEGEGVTGHQTREVCPADTTTYHLHVILQDNSATDRYITIKVKP